MTVGPAVADAEHEVGFEQGRVAVAVAGLQPAHPGHQRMVVGDRAPAHQRRDHRHAHGLGEFHQQGLGRGVVDAATGDDQRALGGAEHVDGFRSACGLPLAYRPAAARRCRRRTRSRPSARRTAGRSAPGRGGRSASRGRPAGTRADQCRLEYGDRPLGDRLGDGLDVHGLEIFLVQAGTRCLPGDAEDRNGVGGCRYRPVIMSVPAGPEVPMHTPMLPGLARV